MPVLQPNILPKTSKVFVDSELLNIFIENGSLLILFLFVSIYDNTRTKPRRGAVYFLGLVKVQTSQQVSRLRSRWQGPKRLLLSRDREDRASFGLIIELCKNQ